MERAAHQGQLCWGTEPALALENLGLTPSLSVSSYEVSYLVRLLREQNGIIYVKCLVPYLVKSPL